MSKPGTTEPDPLLQIHQQIWHELAQATSNRHLGWRTPVMATVAGDGSPNARTVVLRGADQARQTLSFYTDARSPKVDELSTAPAALLVFWCPRLRWQLRVRARVDVVTDSAQASAIWRQLAHSAAAADYLAIAAPGSALDAADRGAKLGGEHHFALLSASVVEMDWLELGRAGSRRATISTDGRRWVVP